jgi:hypothetical protein
MAAIAAPADFAPRRGRARLRVGVTAAIHTVNGRQRITLLNLSESGALLQLKDGEPFDRGVLRWIDYEAFGTVVWRDGQRIALQFDEPIESAWLLDTKARLPALARGSDEFRQFASEWAKGEGSERPRIRASAVRLNRSTSASPNSSGPGTRWAAIPGWLRGGWRILLGGAVAGIAVGIWSCYY